MSEVLAALITVGGTGVFALAAWVSRRLPGEASLVRRVERLAVAHSALPETSPEKKALAVHLIRAGQDLIRWLDVDARLVRRVRIGGLIIGAIASVALTYLVAPFFPDTGVWYGISFLFGAAIGAVVGSVAFAVERHLARRARTRETGAEETETQKRYSAIEHGELSVRSSES